MKIISHLIVVIAIQLVINILLRHILSRGGPVAQWIRHLTTNQGIPGSSPGRVASFFFFSLSFFCFLFFTNF